jgi:hypothetical protein
MGSKDNCNGLANRLLHGWIKARLAVYCDISGIWEQDTLDLV